MKKMISIVIMCFFILYSQFASAEDKIQESIRTKMDEAIDYLKKDEDTPKAWESIIYISNAFKSHPEYNDGAFAEGIDFLVTDILTKPWKYNSPYLTGMKGSPYFRDFLVDHLDIGISPSDLNKIKKNIVKNCDLKKYPTCQKIITKINDITGH